MGAQIPAPSGRGERADERRAVSLAIRWKSGLFFRVVVMEYVLEVQPSSHRPLVRRQTQRGFDLLFWTDATLGSNTVCIESSARRDTL